MPETISAVPQNDYTFLPSPQGAEGPQFVQAKKGAIDHLVRRTSTQKQLNRSLAMSDPHWRPSSNDAKATMHRKTETSASWSSAPLQEALSAYCENKNKADRLRQDLSKPKLRDFLSQEKSGLCFTRTSLTEQEFETFIKALKKAGHGSSSSLPNLLKTAWSKVQQAAHQPASLQQSTAQSARALSDKATAPSHKGLNPIEDDGVSHISNTSPQATTSTDLLPTFFLQLLNAYLRTTNGRSFKNINVEHVKNIEKDITANKTIGTYLKLESGEVRWKDNNASITDGVLTSLLTEFEALHKKKGSLMKLLAKFSIPESGSKEYNAADKAAESQNRNEALQTPRNPALLSQNNVHSAKISIPTSSNNPFDEDKNSTEDTSDTATTERLRTDSALNESAESNPDKYNPFAETSASSDTDPPEELRTDNGPNKIAELNPNKNKIVADAKANSVESANTLSAQNTNEHDADDKNPFAEDDDVSHTSSTSPQAEPSEEEQLPKIFLQFLNQYLKTTDGHSFGETNKKHVEKIIKDIDKNPTIGKYLILENAQLKWRDNNVTKDDLQALLDAFNTRHDRDRSPLFRVLSNFSFPAVGLKIQGTADAQEIIQKVAQPAPHRHGKTEVKEIKRNAITQVLEFFSNPENHNKPLPLSAGVLDQLIEHYSRKESSLKELQKSLNKIKNELTLNDQGLLEAIERALHMVKTEERLKKLSQQITTLDNDVRKKMLSSLKSVQTQHPPVVVAERIVKILKARLQKAFSYAAQQKLGTNTYPNQLNAATIQQIKDQANQNAQAVSKEIIAGHEKKFVDNLTAMVSSFSIHEFLKGKSRENAVANIIAINGTLASLDDAARKHRDENIQQIPKIYADSFMQEVLSRNFENMRLDLANSIKTTVLSNYQHVGTLYKQALDNIKTTPSSNFTQSLDNASKLHELSKGLRNDLTKISATSKEDYCVNLNLQKKDLNQVIEEVSKPLLKEIRETLPKVKSIGQTIKLALIEAFKPTPGRILGCIPLVGGLTIALSTLPKVIAIPLGITAGVVLPFALLGWVGWKIYDHFDQRSQIKHQNTQTLRHLKEIESIATE